MKKTIFTLTIAALAAMTSCNNGGSQAGDKSGDDFIDREDSVVRKSRIRSGLLSTMLRYP